MSFPPELTACLAASAFRGHPAQLATSDPSLATEILPGPPPLAAVAPPPGKTTASTNHHIRRSNMVLTYLPMSDPGSTYVNTLATNIPEVPARIPPPTASMQVDDDSGRKRKRARVDKGAPSSGATRPLRTSVRTSTPLPQADSVPPPIAEPMLQSATPPSELSNGRTTRSAAAATSVPMDIVDASSDKQLGPPPQKKARNAKGKGREDLDARQTETTPSEPQPFFYYQANHDSCSACLSPQPVPGLPLPPSDRDGGGGSLLYCDGCPRSFHFLCLDPPLDVENVPEGGWWCPACLGKSAAVTAPLPEPTPEQILDPLINQLRGAIPREFQLPDEIRSFFKDVVTGPRGGYIDARGLRTQKGNRQLNNEERDPFRLKDKNGKTVLCYRCGKSALCEVSQTSTLSPPDQEMTHEIALAIKVETPNTGSPIPEGSLTMQDIRSTIPAGAAASSPSPSPSSSTGKRKRGSDELALSMSPEAAVPKQVVEDAMDLSPTIHDPQLPLPSVNLPRSTDLAAIRASGQLKLASIIDTSSEAVAGGGTGAGGMRPIVSCDHCSLHWHLDCMTPPMASMPPKEKKWMCPNHLDDLLFPKPRLPKIPPQIITVTSAGQYNNGNIEIIPPSPLIPSHPEARSKRHYSHAMNDAEKIDDVWIGGKRYRIPERVIVLDFWARTKGKDKKKRRGDSVSIAGSSPLTELSDRDSPVPDLSLDQVQPITEIDDETLRAAELLTALGNSAPRNGYGSATFPLQQKQQGIVLHIDPSAVPEKDKSWLESLLMNITKKVITRGEGNADQKRTLEKGSSREVQKDAGADSTQKQFKDKANNQAGLDLTDVIPAEAPVWVHGLVQSALDDVKRLPSDPVGDPTMLEHGVFEIPTPDSEATSQGTVCHSTHPEVAKEKPTPSKTGFKIRIPASTSHPANHGKATTSIVPSRSSIPSTTLPAILPPTPTVASTSSPKPVSNSSTKAPPSMDTLPPPTGWHSTGNGPPPRRSLRRQASGVTPPPLSISPPKSTTASPKVKAMKRKPVVTNGAVPVAPNPASGDNENLKAGVPRVHADEPSDGDRPGVSLHPILDGRLADPPRDDPMDVSVPANE